MCRQRGLWFCLSLVGWTLLSLSSLVALGQEPAESAKDQARLSDLLNRSEQLRREGRPANAVALIEEALVLARKATGEPTKEVVRITEELAKLHEEREDFAAARASRRLVLEMSTKLFGDRDWRTNDARLALANVDRLEGMTRDQRRRLVDLHHSQETAERLFTQRLTADALDPARRALEECRALLGERSREFIRASNILGILYAQDRDLERAEPLLRQAWTLARDMLGEDHPASQNGLINLIDLLEIRESRDRERGAFPSAQRAAREALDLTIKLHGDADWHTGDARRRLEDLDRLGRMKEGDRARLREADAQAAEVHRLWETGKSQEALPLARKVVATRRELLGEAHEMVANSLGRLAEYQEALGDIDGARAARQQVVDIRVRLLGKTHWEVTDARLALADCQRLATLTPGSRLELKSADQLFHEAGELRARGRFREAISPVQQSLAIRRRLLGEDHRLVADALNRLGLLYFSQLELDQADAPYQQAATIRKRVLGEDHPDYAESLNNLATIAMKRARPGQAEEMLKRAKEIMKTSFGEQNASYLICLHDLAGFYHNRGDLAQAEAIMRQALGIACTVFEPEDPMYLGFLSDLATVLVKRADDQLGRGQYESAQRLLWERRAFEAMAYGDLDWRTTDARLDWSDANRLARLEPDQRRLFAESMVMLKRSEESSRRGEFRDAVDGAEEALRGLEATLGRGNRRCLRIVDRLGVLLARQGNLARAESVLRRSTEAHRLALGEEHPDYAATLINLSRVYSIQGDDARAEPLARRAMAILETAVGDRSPLTMAAMDGLIVVRRELSKRAEASGDFAKAQQFREEILALTIRRFGETAPEVTAAKAALGRLDKIQPGDGKSQPKSP